MNRAAAAHQLHLQQTSRNMWGALTPVAMATAKHKLAIILACVGPTYRLLQVEVCEDFLQGALRKALGGHEHWLRFFHSACRQQGGGQGASLGLDGGLYWCSWTGSRLSPTLPVWLI
jgi:hypothetical protein